MNVFTSVHLVSLLKKNYLFWLFYFGRWESRALQEFIVTDPFSTTCRCLSLRQKQVHIQIAAVIKMKSLPQLCRSSLWKCIKKKKLSALYHRQPKQAQELFLLKDILHTSPFCLEAILICICNYLHFLLVYMSVHNQWAELHIKSKSGSIKFHFP